ncbi:hypothetical protein GTP58_23295 [Duganella sp. CY15W]|nr:hypothetical protein [Duganella sp. CY15W]MYM31269.1 hypothetical protein [Duganella sp. CY15W]
MSLRLGKKVVAPARRREIAQWYFDVGLTTVKDVYLALGITHTCFRYQAKLSAANDVVADWLVRLANNWRSWGFGLRFLYLRNEKD